MVTQIHFKSKHSEPDISILLLSQRFLDNPLTQLDPTTHSLIGYQLHVTDLRGKKYLHWSVFLELHKMFGVVILKAYLLQLYLLCSP